MTKYDKMMIVYIIVHIYYVCVQVLIIFKYLLFLLKLCQLYYNMTQCTKILYIFIYVSNINNYKKYNFYMLSHI